MVDFNKMLGGPVPVDTGSDPEMKKVFVQYARESYEGQFVKAFVGRNRRDVYFKFKYPSSKIKTFAVPINDLLELQNVVNQLVNSARFKWSDDPVWKTGE